MFVFDIFAAAFVLISVEQLMQLCHCPFFQTSYIRIIERFGKLTRCVHLHDNMGGQTQADDFHLQNMS
jgi:hypothetical protein